MKNSSTFLALCRSFFLAIIVFSCFKVAISDRYAIIAEDTIENSVFALLLVMLSTVFYLKKHSKIYALLLQLFTLALFIESVYFYLFSVPISASALFIFFETNPQESKEFITTKFDYKVGVLVALYASLVVAFIRFKTQALTRELIKKSHALGGVLLLLCFLKLSHLINHNFPYAMARASFRYFKASMTANQLSNHQSNGVLHQVKDLYPDDAQVHVVVIGESTNRKHFSLYDHYHRNTTPRLDRRRDELIIYDNVISPHSSTSASLIKVLTRDNYEKRYAQKNASIVQLLNEGGYKTYWFSNQPPLDVWSTLVTKIAKASDSTHFFNSENTSRAKVYDDLLVQSLSDILPKVSGKTVVFLHLLGTHTDYKNRYTSDFEKFKALAPSKTVRQSDFINAYDNAVLYNDYIVDQIIQLAKLKKMSSVLYFSDHGEEVYETLDFHGHMADTDKDARLTKDVFEIPFLLWASNDLLEREDLDFQTKRAYMMDDLFHSIAHLFGVQADQVDRKRSIFSKTYVPRKRMVGHHINFDTHLK